MRALTLTLLILIGSDTLWAAETPSTPRATAARTRGNRPRPIGMGSSTARQPTSPRTHVGPARPRAMTTSTGPARKPAAPRGPQPTTRRSASKTGASTTRSSAVRSSNVRLARQFGPAPVGLARNYGAVDVLPATYRTLYMGYSDPFLAAGFGYGPYQPWIYRPRYAYPYRYYPYRYGYSYYTPYSYYSPYSFHGSVGVYGSFYGGLYGGYGLPYYRGCAPCGAYSPIYSTWSGYYGPWNCGIYAAPRYQRFGGCFYW